MDKEKFDSNTVTTLTSVDRSAIQKINKKNIDLK